MGGEGVGTNQQHFAESGLTTAILPCWPRSIMTSAAPSRSAVSFVFVTVLLDMVGFGLIIPVLPGLIGEVGGVGIGDAAIVAGWMFFAFSAAQFLFAPIMGALSDAFGRRPLLLLAVGGLMADYVFSALAPTLFWLFVGRVIAGV